MQLLSASGELAEGQRRLWPPSSESPELAGGQRRLWPPSGESPPISDPICEPASNQGELPGNGDCGHPTTPIPGKLDPGLGFNPRCRAASWRCCGPGELAGGQRQLWPPSGESPELAGRQRRLWPPSGESPPVCMLKPVIDRGCLPGNGDCGHPASLPKAAQVPTSVLASVVLDSGPEFNPRRR